METAALLDHQGAAVAGDLLGVEVREVGDLTDLPGGEVAGPDIHGVVAVRQEIDRIAEPNRCVVVRSVPGKLLFLQRLQVDEAEGIVLAAAVVAELGLPRLDHLVGHPPAVGGKGTLKDPRKGQRLGHSSPQGDRP